MADENMEQSFAEMFEASESGDNGSIQVGDKVRGTIIAVEPSTVFVDLGSKVDGVVEAEELRGEDGELMVTVGDEVELFVVRAQGGEIRLSRALSGVGGLHMLQEAFESKLPVQGKVKEAIKGGFHVEVLTRRAFCPVSQIDDAYVENTEPYIGETFEFLITKLEEKGRNIVVSRRILLEKEKQAAAESFFESTEIGAVVDCVVKRLAPFGAFVEIEPGVEGLVHISELGWSRVDEPSEVVSEGDNIRAEILKIDTDDKGRPKISLSMKQVQEDPWNTVGDAFKEGEIVTGRVVRLADFGAFVEIAPGVDGLVHVSEMSWAKRVNKPSEIVSQGDEVQVKIKSIDQGLRRISLSLRDAEGDPWAEAAEKYAPGTKVTGTFEKSERFGLFINLEPGVTGLMPKSLMAKAADPKKLDALKSGDPVAVTVQSVDAPARRISLAPGDALEEEDWSRFQDKAARPSGGAGGGPSMGILGEKLQQAIKDKDDK